jgi:hypothetical protein
MQLLCVKSIRRNLPLNGTASFDRSLVNGRIHSLPLHPAIIITSTWFIAELFLPLKDPVNRNRETTPMISNDGH